MFSFVSSKSEERIALGRLSQDDQKNIKHADPPKNNFAAVFSVDQKDDRKNGNLPEIRTDKNDVTKTTIEDAEKTPVITIGTNGNWFIDGVDTGRNPKEIKEKNAPAITMVVKKEQSSIVNFSENLSVEADIDQKLLITGWGDSLTAGAGGNGTTYLTVLESLIGKKYRIVNCGVGGETAATVAARQGGVTAYLKKGFTLPETTDWVAISENSTNGNTLINKYNKTISPLLQGTGYSVNPCYIKGIECTLDYDYFNKKWRIHRNKASKSKTVVAKDTPLFFYGSRAYRNPYAQIIWIGQNAEGHSSNAQLIEYYRSMIDFSGCKNTLVIGLHTGTEESRAELEKEMSDAFGQRYINWRKYICSTEAFEDAGIKPTKADLEAIAAGSLPPAFWSSSTDAVHFNAKAYKLLGKQVYKRFQMLGIL